MGGFPIERKSSYYTLLILFPKSAFAKDLLPFIALS